MKGLAYLASMLFAGTVLGSGLFWLATDRAIIDTGIQNGSWVTNTAYGDKDANPALKTGVARRGLLALKKSETIYFTAYTDKNGDWLSESCAYRVTGTAPKTRWWSFTLYGEDNFLIDNPENTYSIFMDPETNGVDFLVSAKAPDSEQDWLPSAGGGKISITLRLYNPSPEVYRALETTPLPTITRESCV